MTGEFRIVRGNDYPLKIYLDHMEYDDNGLLKATAVNLNTIDNFHVYAFKGDYYIELEATIASNGTYLLAIIPSKDKKRCLCLGDWGISVTGILNGYQIAATEHHVFSIVPCNARSYIPPTIVNGEDSYMYNLRFGSLDAKEDGGGGDDPQPSTTSGYLGFATFNNVSEVNLNSLDAVNNLFTSSGFSLVNTTEGTRLIVVCNKNIQLNITIAGLPAGMNSEVYGNYRYYYTAPQRAIADAPYLINITKI